MGTTTASSRFGSVRHLADRFFGSLGGAGPTAEDELWALDHLLEGERQLWRRMSGSDRRHAVRVAKDAEQLLQDNGHAPGREVLAGALLHDIGKIESHLGTFGRVRATVAAAILGRDRIVGASDGAVPAGWRAGARLYLLHDHVGAELLRDASSDPFTIAWAEQHHLSPDRWTINRRVGELLKAADGS